MGLIRNRWPVICRINEVREGREWIIHDRAKFKRDKHTGEVTFQFRKYKAKCPSIPFNHIRKSRLGDIIDFISPAPNEIYSVYFDQAAKEMKATVDPELFKKLAWDNKQATTRWKTSKPLDKLLHIFMVAILAVMVVVMMVIYMQGFGDFVTKTVEPLQRTASETAHAAVVTQQTALIMLEMLKGMGFNMNNSFVNQTLLYELNNPLPGAR